MGIFGFILYIIYLSHKLLHESLRTVIHSAAVFERSLQLILTVHYRAVQRSAFAVSIPVLHHTGKVCHKIILYHLERFVFILSHLGELKLTHSYQRHTLNIGMMLKESRLGSFIEVSIIVE